MKRSFVLKTFGVPKKILVIAFYVYQVQTSSPIEQNYPNLTKHTYEPNLV
jgi:hypothetical protein